MTLYKVILEQKITKRLEVVVDSDSYDHARDKAKEGNIISAERTLDVRIDDLIPIEIEKY